MPYRIVLTGSECTGKTTLAAELAAHYGVQFVPEYLRGYFEMKKGILSIDDVVPIARGQLESERKAREKGHKLFICDTDIISSIVYSKHYFGACPRWLEDKLEKLPQSLYLLCDIDVEWEADGQRDMEHGRQYMQELFSKELESRDLLFHTISGSKAQRFSKSLELIDLHLSGISDI